MCPNIIQLLRLCIEERREIAAMPISVMIMMPWDEVRLVAAGETSHSFLFFFLFLSWSKGWTRTATIQGARSLNHLTCSICDKYVKRMYVLSDC
jgi:hypothetical protein